MAVPTALLIAAPEVCPTCCDRPVWVLSRSLPELDDPAGVQVAVRLIE